MSIDITCPECGAYVCKITHAFVTGDVMSADRFFDLWDNSQPTTGGTLVCRCGFDLFLGLHKGGCDGVSAQYAKSVRDQLTGVNCE